MRVTSPCLPSLALLGVLWPPETRLLTPAAYQHSRSAPASFSLCACRKQIAPECPASVNGLPTWMIKTCTHTRNLPPETLQHIDAKGFAALLEPPANLANIVPKKGSSHNSAWELSAPAARLSAALATASHIWLTGCCSSFACNSCSSSRSNCPRKQPGTRFATTFCAPNQTKQTRVSLPCRLSVT